MGMFRAILLFVFLISAGLTAGVVLGGHASASGSPFHQTFGPHAAAVLKDGCRSETTGKHDSNLKRCCQSMNCGHSGVIAMTPSTMPALFPITSHEPGAAGHIAGISIAPDTGPPKLLA